MHDSRDAAVVRSLLIRTAQRLRTLAACRGAAIGLVAAAIVILVAGRTGLTWTSAAIIAASLAVVGALIGWFLARPNAPAVLEARVPDSRNLLFTASELLHSAHQTSAPVAQRIVRDAAAIAERVSLPRILPARTATAIATFALVLPALSAAIATTRGHSAVVNSDAAVIRSFDVTVNPPEYSGRPAIQLNNPTRIEAMAGSRVDLSVRVDGAAMTATVFGAAIPVTTADASHFTASLVATTDGFITLAAQTSTGSAGVPQVIELVVTPDTAPRVRITAPARDLIVASGPRTLEITVEAIDDVALELLRLRYTKISGSGENFTFAEGDVAVTTSRKDARNWSARANWPLASLGLEPGDTLIYKGVATDGRPGAPPAESDAFIVEISAPGHVPAEGFAVDDRMDKYAISQQMVILRTERLMAARGSMSAENFKSDALDIAAEQRQVRAEFVFMMGGELAEVGLDLNMLQEEEEAHGEADLAAGRLVNQGRAELLRAIRAMSRAAAHLTDINLTSALPIEKEALDHLQKAFSRSRYILRTLGARERIDATRRLTGVLEALARLNRSASGSAADVRALAIQRALVDLAAWAADPNRASPRGAARASQLAQQIRLIDPASGELRDAASALAAAANSRTNDAPAVQASIDRAQSALAAAARPSLQPAPDHQASSELAALAGALHDALRRGKR